jgi:glycosyltransferase involved in cell wall biosynthesis
MNKLISICLPTYNGGSTIDATLSSIIKEINQLPNPDLEVVLTDDASTDDTFARIQSLAEKYSYLRVFKNKKNLGMDLNFRQAALNASGKYIWFCGQDDLFLPGVVEHVVSSLQAHPEISLVNINFSQYSEEQGKIICPSMFHLQAHDPARLDLGPDLIFHGAAEYFRFFNDAPSFLPATIMRKDFWLKTDTSPYVGTAFIQYAAILLNLKDAKILAITPPLIRGLIPAAGWQKDGHKLFTIQLGIMTARTLVWRDSRNPLPAALFQAKKRAYLWHFLRVVIASYRYGFRPTKNNYRDLQLVYGPWPCYLYFFPIIFLVGLTPRLILKFLFFIKYGRQR